MEQLEDEYLEFIELFNERCFYDCHEVLEELWLDYEGPARRFYQGLIHLASAYLLLMRGNMRGCRARFLSTLEYFRGYPAHYLGLDLQPLMTNVMMWIDRLENTPRELKLDYVDADVPLLSLRHAAAGAEI